MPEMILFFIYIYVPHFFWYEPENLSYVKKLSAWRKRELIEACNTEVNQNMQCQLYSDSFYFLRDCFNKRL